MLADLATSAGMLVGDMSKQSRDHVDAMGSQVGALVESIGGATKQIAVAVDRLESVTTDAIGRMNSGAETLAIAADDFAKAGSGVTGVLAKSESLTQQLAQAAGSVGLATKSLDGVLADYRVTRDALQKMLEAMQGSVEAARKEASLTGDVLSRLEGATARLATAQKSADEYLGNVTRVLEDAHRGFAENVQRTLGVANKSFYDSLTSATKLLREAIAELEQTLGSFNPARR
jgi:ABC-type transporter Mla subunit MlaD